jgi:hypothetical protein
MKRIVALGTAILAGVLCSARADTTIDPTNRYAWGANIGFTDWRPSTTDGVNIGTNFCAGFIYQRISAGSLGHRSTFLLAVSAAGRPQCAQPKPRLMIFGREVLEGGMAALLGEAPV